MQIENDYDKEVYNGDIGTVDGVDSNAGEIIASFDGRSITYGFGELDMLVPAYAATIHKSQGSGIPVCDHPGAHPALPHAAAEPSVHRCHTRQAAGRAGGAEEGHCHRGTKRLRPAEVVEVGRMVVPKSILLTTNWPGELRHGSFEMSSSLRCLRCSRA
jgi:hypothetical protein